MSEELKDTFDGYLMFDFSNFHGLMAQTFDNEEIDIPRVEKQPKRKAYNIPGPYLDSPPIEFERSGDCSEGILFNGQLGEDDIPEVNLDEDCLSNFNYSTSGFNLLANLDFEPDEDAYDNAINATSEPNSLHHRNSKISRTKKISIFSPTLQFDDNVDQKIQMITLQNMELLKKEDHYDIDDFYKFLTSLDFLNVSNQKHNDDLMKVDQLFHLVQIRQFFDKMVVILFQKTDQSHSISYTSKLDSFKEKMDHFINLVQYMVDDGTYRQKSLRDQHVFKKDYTLTMSVAFFKGLEIISLYKSLLMQKNMQDRLKRYTTAKKNLHSYWRLWGLIKEFEISFVQKNIQKSPNLTNSTLGNQKESVELAILDPHAKIQIARNKDNNNKISLQGFDKYLNKPSLKNTNYCFAGKWNQKKLQTKQLNRLIGLLNYDISLLHKLIFSFQMAFTFGTASYFLNKSSNIEIDFNCYCEKHELQSMVTECTKFFVRKANIQPQIAFQEFVQCYIKGETVLLRPYQQICNSKMNRLVFVINFNKIFESFEDKSGFDYFQLTKLLCSDFPRDIVVSSLSLYANLDEELLFKKTFTLLQFCKALLFELLFENILQELNTKLNNNGIIDSILPILKKYYPNNDEQLYLPNPAAIFECLMKFSNEKNKACLHPILPFTVDMFSTQYLNGGIVEFSSLKQQLFKNTKVDVQLTKLITLIENSNQRIQDCSRLDEDENKKKKQK